MRRPAMRPGEQVEGKAPTAGVNPAGAARGSGATPRVSETAKMYKYKMPYRKCRKAAGLTYPIAICFECKKVIDPSATEPSRTGAHATWYYAHEHPLAFIVLEQTNSGNFLLSLDCFRCLLIACSFIWFSPPRIISFL